MNALTRDLVNLVNTAEENQTAKEQTSGTQFREKLHLMPPVGWLNDPNGLCQMDGVFHAFFQYSPFNAEGGVKMWGHYTSTNLIDWEYKSVSLYPDQPFDCHGVYSGSAFLEDGTMYLYYTGNVKLEDGDFDYINTGREANTVLVTTKDGIHFGSKKELLRNSDYPSDLTCHVRDPKVWKKDDTYYMIQGARTKNDVGQALIFESSVQGLEGKEWADRNVYQSGYFLVDGDILDSYKLSSYHLWDYGFDYYAPQSFEAEDGRRIHISWMGMPDCEEYTNPTIKDGWQHCFTFPREVFIKDGKVCQKPVRELDAKKQQLQDVQNELTQSSCPVYEVNVEGIKENHFQAVLSDELILDYENGRFQMHFTNKSKTSVSAGRSLRYAEVGTLENVKILADTSSVEVFVNDGEFVFSTRYYPNDHKIVVHSPSAHITFDKIQ